MKKLWFRRKRYGWGWVPSSWEGWLTILAYIIGLMLLYGYTDSKAGSAGDMWATLVLVLLTAGLVAISYLKGEKPRWQWGRREDDTL